jgi:DNA-binding transcriptional LysR family regulator
VNDIATGVALAAEGLGYILLTNTYLPRPIDPALAAIPLTSGSMPRPLHVAYLDKIPAAARALVDCLKEQLAFNP